MLRKLESNKAFKFVRPNRRENWARNLRLPAIAHPINIKEGTGHKRKFGKKSTKGGKQLLLVIYHFPKRIKKIQLSFLPLSHSIISFPTISWWLVRWNMRVRFSLPRLTNPTCMAFPLQWYSFSAGRSIGAARAT